MSIVLSVFFQSLSGWQRISERVNTVATDSILSTIEIRQFKFITEGLIAAWPEQEAQQFNGTPGQITGLTRNALHRDIPGLYSFTLRLQPVENESQTTLFYQSGETQWQIAQFPSLDVSFRYLGADGVWIDHWPPATNPKLRHSTFDEESLFNTPQLPEAILIAGADIFWISVINTNTDLANRLSDLTNAEQ